MSRISNEVEQQILQDIDNAVLTRKSIAAKYGVHPCTVYEVNKRRDKEIVTSKPQQQITKEESENSYTVSTKSTKIRTVSDAISAADVDLSVWSVERSKCN